MMHTLHNERGSREEGSWRDKWGQLDTPVHFFTFQILKCIAEKSQVRQ